MKQIVVLVFLAVVVLTPLATKGQQSSWKLEFTNKTAYPLSPTLKELLYSLTAEAQSALDSILKMKQPLTINIILDSAGTVKETGNAGFPVSMNTIQWVVDPYHKLGLDSIILLHYKTIVYHECSHLYRGWTSASGRKSNDFMDAVIAEGLATCFEKQFRKSKPLWGEYPSNVESWVNELLKLSPAAYREYGRWMFEHQDGRKWIGYKAGTYLVEKAMQNSGRELVDLSRLPTVEILRMAGYERKN